MKNTPHTEQRPLIDCNGVLVPMDDRQYAEYLEFQRGDLPTPPPSTDQEIAALREELSAAKILLGLEG